MSPICRAYFKDGHINSEGQHVLAENKNYVRSMREVADEMGVPFLDMTAATLAEFEHLGKEFCMAHYFNCGDKTHTSAEGGLAVAMLASRLIDESTEVNELRSWLSHPYEGEMAAYAQAIETRGQQAAFAAEGEVFSSQLSVFSIQNIERQRSGYTPIGGLWPAGEIDEVANRYIEYTISAEKKKGLVIETITIPVCGKGGEGMNIHINYGFGDIFRDVTTIYENTALPKNKKIVVRLDQPILVPAGETLHIRILPWYDSNGRPQNKKYLQLGELKVSGKRLR